MSNQNENNSSNQEATPTYINHMFAGTPIIYIYEIGEYTNNNTGNVNKTFKGHIKTGRSDQNNYVPVQGHLSPAAYESLEALEESVNNGSTSLGVKAKSPRFEGVDAFVPKNGKDLKTDTSGQVLPVGVLNLRLNYIESIQAKKKKPANDGQTPQAAQQAAPSAAALDVSSTDIEFGQANG